MGDALKGLYDGFFSNLVDDGLCTGGAPIGIIRNGSVTPDPSDTRGTQDIVGLCFHGGMLQRIRALRSLPCNLLAVTDSVTAAGDEVVMSPLIAFGFMEAVRVALGGDGARIALVPAPTKSAEDHDESRATVMLLDGT